MEIYADGMGWNGAKCGFCITDGKGSILMTEFFDEKHTNNEMEYQAIINALKLAKKNDIIYTDSRLVVGQVVWHWNVNKEHLIPLVDKAKELARKKQVQIYWISRKLNKAGKALEKLQHRIKNIISKVFDDNAGKELWEIGS